MKMLAVLPLFIVALCAIKCCVSGSCPSAGWKQFEVYCYKALNYGNDWQESKEKCNTLDADLVKINSAEENEFVLQLAREQAPSVESVWLGLSWHYKTKSWSWDDESSPVYMNWNENEPNGYLDDQAYEGCVEMYTGISGSPINGFWNDVDCSPSDTETAPPPLNGFERKQIGRPKRKAMKPKGLVCKKLA